MKLRGIRARRRARGHMKGWTRLLGMALTRRRRYFYGLDLAHAQDHAVIAKGEQLPNGAIAFSEFLYIKAPGTDKHVLDAIGHGVVVPPMAQELA